MSSTAISDKLPCFTMKTTLITILSLLLVGSVICWITGVFPSAPTRKTPTLHLGKGDVPAAASEDNLSVYFSPSGGCTDAILREVAKAKDCVYVQAAQFTYSPIAKALVAAKARGVDVRVVIDSGKNEGEKSEADRLIAGKVPTFSDAQHHTAHNKVILIDHHVIFTGSFNLTRESESENAENLLLIEGKPKLVAAYEANFKEHLAHSTKYAK
jgi:phosphatidylserine/phosphatidylglycerophosphate/cardiolipin synthase-like enzyme